MKEVEKMKTILVVDDSELARVKMMFLLQSCYKEVNILFAETIKQAWKLLNNEKIDIAIIDIYLPGENGVDLISKMLEDEKFKKIPVIVVTGTNEDSFVKKSFEKYVHAYLHKPIVKEALVSSIKQLL